MAIECNHCGQVVPGAEKYRGKRIRCPICKEPFVVPTADTQLDPFTGLPMEDNPFAGGENPFGQVEANPFADEDYPFHEEVNPFVGSVAGDSGWNPKSESPEGRTAAAGPSEAERRAAMARKRKLAELKAKKQEFPSTGGVASPTPARVAPPTTESTQPTGLSTPSALPIGKKLLDYRIEAVEIFQVRLKGREESTPAVDRIWVKLISSSGQVGWGEAAMPEWSNEETAESQRAMLSRRLIPAVVGLPLWDRDGLARAMDLTVRGGDGLAQPYVKCAMDLALHDALARTLEIPLWALLGSKRTDQFALAVTINASDPESATQLARDAVESGFSSLRIQAHSGSPTAERAKLEAIRETVGPATYLWVDAGQAFDFATAGQLVRQLASVGVELVVDPMPGHRILDYEQLARFSPCPIGVDEVRSARPQLFEILAQAPISRVVVRLGRSGGLGRLAKTTALVESSGRRLLAACGVESELATAFSLHAFAALGNYWPICIDSVGRFEIPFLETPLSIVEGVIHLPEGPGSGMVVDEFKLRESALVVEPT